jgi:nitrogen fixation protein FixH
MSVPTPQIKGWHVGLFFVVFFGIMIAVNAAFVVAAISTHPGDDVPDAYQHGRAFNRVLRANHAQAELGWQAVVRIAQSAPGLQTISISILDKSGKPVAGLTVEAMLRHPAVAGLDRPIAFHAVASGRYETVLDESSGVHWDLDVTALSDMHPAFHVRHRL